jgi:hypothetical protein
MFYLVLGVKGSSERVYCMREVIEGITEDNGSTCVYVCVLVCEQLQLLTVKDLVVLSWLGEFLVRLLLVAHYIKLLRVAAKVLPQPA